MNIHEFSTSKPLFFALLSPESKEINRPLLVCRSIVFFSFFKSFFFSSADSSIYRHRPTLFLCRFASEYVRERRNPFPILVSHYFTGFFPFFFLSHQRLFCDTYSSFPVSCLGCPIRIQSQSIYLSQQDIGMLIWSDISRQAIHYGT